jgi:hypothetical protein
MGIPANPPASGLHEVSYKSLKEGDTFYIWYEDSQRWDNKTLKLISIGRRANNPSISALSVINTNGRNWGYTIRKNSDMRFFKSSRGGTRRVGKKVKKQTRRR